MEAKKVEWNEVIDALMEDDHFMACWEAFIKTGGFEGLTLHKIAAGFYLNGYTDAVKAIDYDGVELIPTKTILNNNKEL